LGVAGLVLMVQAHEGHGGIAPTFQEVVAGAEPWQVGLGIVPADPVAGETLHLEVKATAKTASGAATGRVADASQVRLLLDDTPVAVQTADAPGVLRGIVVADDPGEHTIHVEVGEPGGASGRAAFPLRVSPGPAARLRPMILIGLLLLLASIGGASWRSWRNRWQGATPVGRAALVALGAAIVFLIVPASRALGGMAARQFLPDRSEQAVDWIVETPMAIAETPGGHGEAGGPHGAAADVRQALSGEEVAGIVARVIASPGGVAEIVVPMAGRVIPTEGLRVSVGARVSKGQALASLQPTYIVHDAMHLINLRWPILQSLLDSRRRMLEAEATAERMKLALVEKAVSTRAVQEAEATAATARQEHTRWQRTLAMHDDQIRDKQPARFKFTAPISGQIAAANFAQGQLVYEGDPLFTIVDVSTVWVEVRVPERLVSRFREQTIDFVSSAYPDTSFTGRLQRVAPAVDSVSRTVSHFYAVQNPRGLLRIGLLLRVAAGSPAVQPHTS
jgi:RND family efflux transporter MFP subunit